MTHAQFKKAQLDHLADEILEAGGDIDHAAQNIADTYPTTNIQDYTNIDQPELDAMNLTKASSTYPVPILGSLKKQILAMKGFWQCWGDNLTQEWTTVTIDNFEEYVLMDTGPNMLPPVTGAGPTAAPTTSSVNVAAITMAVSTAMLT